jgi:hypothetical protein
MTVVGRRCWLWDGIGRAGGPLAGDYLVAAPRPGRVWLLVGWPVCPGLLRLPVVVSALSWA